MQSEEKDGMLSNEFQPCVQLICMVNHGFIHSQFPDMQTVIWGKILQVSMQPIKSYNRFNAPALQKKNLFSFKFRGI